MSVPDHSVGYACHLAASHQLLHITALSRSGYMEGDGGILHLGESIDKHFEAFFGVEPAAVCQPYLALGFFDGFGAGRSLTALSTTYRLLLSIAGEEDRNSRLAASETNIMASMSE